MCVFVVLLVPNVVHAERMLQHMLRVAQDMLLLLRHRMVGAEV